ncbi:MAG TPA: amidophosphoribosyltransferase [Candidatus Sulfotelmatobacter sp.]|nr:amidophosphoribosyltransferase [Candidatus Sulfotelmatobacter sp.]
MTDEPLDRLHEECGVFGVFSDDEDVANLTYFGLYALQHRGQESAGIAAGDGRAIRVHRQMGLVSQVFDQDDLLGLPGFVAIGHTRYSTTGSARLTNAQPMRFEHGQIGPLALAHNGNLVNAAELRVDLVEQGVEFESTSDTEVIGSLLTRTPGDSIELVLRRALPRLEGAYCLLLCTPSSLVAARDPLGIRPMCLGRICDPNQPGGDGYVIASETCALDVVGAKFVREIEPGEIVTVTAAGVQSAKLPSPSPRRAMCSFEFIYFARPDSVMVGRSLYEARATMGRELAREAPCDADIVIALPDSGTPAATGYSQESGLAYVEGMIKSRYITRTFIQPTQRLRESGTRLKFNPMRHVLEGKRVVLVDDSIVRGTTSRRIVEELRRAGASEVHMRIASPPIVWPCFMGIDIASRRELVAADTPEEEVGRIIGADSLRYLSMDGLRRAVGDQSGNGFCFACFDGKYPIDVPVQLEMDKLAMEKDVHPLPLTVKPGG